MVKSIIKPANLAASPDETQTENSMRIHYLTSSRKKNIIILKLRDIFLRTAGI